MKVMARNQNQKQKQKELEQQKQIRSKYKRTFTDISGYLTILLFYLFACLI